MWKYSLILLSLAACSSTPHYEKMRTAEQAITEYDQNVVKDGMAITKKGAVIDIKIEEVQAQKKRLEVTVAEKDEKIDYLERKIAELNEDMMQLRIRAGLPANKPKPEAKCCTGDGKLISLKPAPSLDQEMASRGKVESEPIGQDQ